MTNEKASIIIGNIPVYGDECYSIAEYQEAKTLAVQALLHKPKVAILDTIREEIMDTGAYEQEIYGATEFLKGINYCLGVIDKYMKEMREHEKT